MIQKGILLLFVVLFYQSVFSQEKLKKEKLVQFSGVVVSGDSLIPVPYTSIIIKNSRRGTISDFYGYFSLVARANDTIKFSSVGFKKAEYVIPDTLKSNRYSLIQMLTRDTVNLPEAVVYPWPTPEQFKQAFINLHIPDDDLERAKRNLAREAMKEKYQSLPMGASLNYKYQMSQYQSRLYYAGQAPPLSILNPLAWAKFIDAWKRGDFKRK